jgi:uncharacterized protein (DUF927 family)
VLEGTRRWTASLRQSHSSLAITAAYFKDTRRWRLLLLSSGEIDLATHMADSRKTTRAGQEVRIINIPAKPSINSHGIFEDIHGFNSGASFVEYLSEASSRYYGAPIVEFIRHVIEDYEKIIPNVTTNFLSQARRPLLLSESQKSFR